MFPEIETCFQFCNEVKKGKSAMEVIAEIFSNINCAIIKIVI